MPLKVAGRMFGPDMISPAEVPSRRAYRPSTDSAKVAYAPPSTHSPKLPVPHIMKQRHGVSYTNKIITRNTHQRVRKICRSHWPTTVVDDLLDFGIVDVGRKWPLHLGPRNSFWKPSSPIAPSLSRTASQIPQLSSQHIILSRL